MDRIATYKRTKEIVEANEFYFKKNFGQNFLIDQHVVNKILNTADITNEDLIIEIGPGIGGLTQELLERAGKVVAIEIDTNLIPILKDNLIGYNNLEIINEDVLKVDLLKLIEESGYRKVKLVANLPYYITTPIIMNLLENNYPIDSIIVMIQKEVASRMSADVNTKAYGSLTVVVNYFADVYLAANVPQNCFIPRPKVDSAVIKITPHDPFKVKNEEFFFKLVKAAFSMRRKTLVNCLFSFDIGFSKDEIGDILESIGLDRKVRGESLSIEKYGELSDKICEKRTK
ncbi:MAG: 16S rRNA (adenine(1518)-N(6)/adenine(1519)-N(6))-dimethyltransferase RsmA [Lachnospirales bacterium]